MATQSVSAPASILNFPTHPRTTHELEDEAILQLSRNLAYRIHGASFDRCTIEERIEIAHTAAVAWHTMQDVINGTAAPVPHWERQCLTFTGPYDLALIQAIPKTGEVQ
jgi:hypothetical protein